MKEINCEIFGHSLNKSSAPNAHIKEYKCSCCHKSFTQDGYGEIVILDSFWKQNNENLRASFGYTI
jgi:hypothetical protein